MKFRQLKKTKNSCGLFKDLFVYKNPLRVALVTIKSFFYKSSTNHLLHIIDFQDITKKHKKNQKIKKDGKKN